MGESLLQGPHYIETKKISLDEIKRAMEAGDMEYRERADTLVDEDDDHINPKHHLND